MKATISTLIQANENDMWEELQNVSSLMHVASPLLKFRPEKNHTIPEKWEVGREYKFWLFFLGVIPLGEHCITLAEINPGKKTIISNERGRLAKIWNHIIKILPYNEQAIQYIDEIDIKAGVLTIPIWLFAHVFYRHRQRRWKNVLER